MGGLFTRFHKELFTFSLLLLCCQAYSQCPTGLALSTAEMVTNGDFSAGNTNFTSDHNYCNTAGCVTTGKYTVGSDPSVYEPSFEGTDHTSGNGNFLIVNKRLHPLTNKRDIPILQDVCTISELRNHSPHIHSYFLLLTTKGAIPSN